MRVLVRKVTARHLKTFRIISNEIPVSLLIPWWCYFSCLQTYSNIFFNNCSHELKLFWFFFKYLCLMETAVSFLKNKSVFLKYKLYNFYYQTLKVMLLILQFQKMFQRNVEWFIISVLNTKQQKTIQLPQVFLKKIVLFLFFFAEHLSGTWRVCFNVRERTLSM